MNILIADGPDLSTFHRVSTWAGEWAHIHLNYVSQTQKLFDLLNAKLPDILFVDPASDDFKLWKTVEEITSQHKTLPIVIYSGLCEFIFGLPYMRMGIRGFLQKPGDSSDFLNCIAAIHSGQRYMSSRFWDFTLGTSDEYDIYARFQLLTRKELEVLYQYQRRRSNKGENLRKRNWYVTEARIRNKLNVEDLEKSPLFVVSE